MKKELSRFYKILQDIKTVKIQGAENIAKAGINAFLISQKSQNPLDAKKASERINSVRITEPLLQNALKILVKQENYKKQKSSAEKFLKYLKKSNQKIAIAGEKLIKNDMNIFSHCHSSTVISILKLAKKKKKRFVVYTTEVEPLLQGRKTAEELAKSGIKVIVFPDLAAEQALRRCDLLLFGADAFTKKGIVNKIGTNILSEIAKQNNIPRYSCGVSLKFTKKVKLEIRKPSELWHENIKLIQEQNPAFDFVNRKLITGVISEFGILTHKQFAKKAKQNLKKFLK